MNARSPLLSSCRSSRLLFVSNDADLFDMRQPPARPSARVGASSETVPESRSLVSTLAYPNLESFFWTVGRSLLLLLSHHSCNNTVGDSTDTLINCSFQKGVEDSDMKLIDDASRSFGTICCHLLRSHPPSPHFEDIVSSVLNSFSRTAIIQ